MMPGQCCLIPSNTFAKRSGAQLGVPWSLTTCRCTSVAPASKASCVDSICSDAAIGTAGLSFLPGTEPVIATVMMQGFVMAILQSRCGNRPSFRTRGNRDLDEIEVRVAYVDRSDRAGSSRLHHRTLHYFDSCACQFPDHLLEGCGSDEAQVQAAGHRHVRLGIELPAPFVQVDLLVAELEREALPGWRPESLKSHAEDLGIEADAGVLVAGGEDDVVDVVDHFPTTGSAAHFLSNFLRAFSKASCMLLKAASVPFIMAAHASTEALCSRRSSAIAASRFSRNCSSCFM